MTAPRNIYCYVEPGERRHLLGADCWCVPAVTTLLAHAKSNENAGVIICHSGNVRPAVTASIHRRDLGVSSLFDREKIRSAPGVANSDAS